MNSIDILNERIKELSCLYEVASLASNRSKNPEETLQAIVNRIPKAWCFPEFAICELKVRDYHLFSAEISVETISQQQQIFIENQQVGTIFIHYPRDKREKNHFLVEENALLKKLSDEIATFLERIESKAREDAFIQNFQRQDRLGILGEITAGIAHELNTPLGNILGFAQLILETERNTQTLSDAQKIMNSAIHAREVVKKLMFFACELPQQFEYISINAVVKDALQLLTPSFQKADIRCVFTHDTQNSFIQVDPVQLTQVIFNLIINAIHASEPNSTVSISIQRLDMQLTILIADEGKGIPIEIQEKIFEPFFTTKPTGEGSGLGLSVVHGIIKAHGGSIQVASELNKGTTFSIKLPINQAE